jgi:PPOX class probable F420-dependent enzyme
MNLEQARRRLAAARVGRLATVTPAGAPHLVPVVFALVDDVLYSAVDGKPKTTTALQRLTNIEATGRASLLVDQYSEDWSALWWVRVDGPADVLTADDSELLISGNSERAQAFRRQGRPGQVSVAVEALSRKYPQYVGQPPTGPFISLRLTHWRWWEASPSQSG